MFTLFSTKLEIHSFEDGGSLFYFLNKILLHRGQLIFQILPDFFEVDSQSPRILKKNVQARNVNFKVIIKEAACHVYHYITCEMFSA